MVTRLRAILSTLRPSCLHNQPYRRRARCGLLAWSRLGGSHKRIKALLATDSSPSFFAIEAGLFISFLEQRSPNYYQLINVSREQWVRNGGCR